MGCLDRRQSRNRNELKTQSPGTTTFIGKGGEEQPTVKTGKENQKSREIKPSKCDT